MASKKETSQKVANAINALGAVAELLHVFYEDLIQQGFSGEDAIFLCSTYLETMLPGGANR